MAANISLNDVRKYMIEDARHIKKKYRTAVKLAALDEIEAIYNKDIRVIYNIKNSGGILQTKNARLPADVIKVAALEALKNDDILVIDGDHWVVENATNTFKYNNPDKMIYTYATLKKKVNSSGSQY